MHIVIFAQKMLMECYLSIKDKLPNTLKMEDLIGNWNILHISAELVEAKKKTCILGSMLENI